MGGSAMRSVASAVADGWVSNEVGTDLGATADGTDLIATADGTHLIATATSLRENASSLQVTMLT